MSLKLELCIITQTNPWLMTWSVPGPGGFEGKFGEISGTNDVQPVTTGQYPHNFQGKNIDKHSSVIRPCVMAKMLCYLD